jgi:hypothetical protein
MVLKGKPRKLIQGVNDLATTHPEIAKQADGWDPNLIVAGSHNKVDWNCPKGHKFIAAIQDRTRRGDNCSICAGKQVLVGFNDLKTLFPETAKQAYGWEPTEFTAGSGKKKEWMCPFGHIWITPICARTKSRGTNCAVCNGKQVNIGTNDLKTLFPEIAKQANGWNPEEITAGSGKRKSWKCEFGHEWDAIVADRTKRGDGCAICSGRKALSGFNDLLITHPEFAIQAFEWDPRTVTHGSGIKKKWRCVEGHIWDATVASRTNMNAGCPYCSGNKVWPGFNDLATTHPSIALELISTEPKFVSAGSNLVSKWQCNLNHEYEMTIHARVNVISCPICSGARILPGFNDLKTTNPDVANFADGWNPELFSAGSNKEVKWRCSLEHTWKAPIYSLTLQGTRCPICSGQQFKKGFNDLQTTHPDLAAQAHGWDPSEIGASSDKKLEWTCLLEHVFKAQVYNRAFRGDKCSICSGKQVLKGFNDLWTTNPEIAAQVVDGDPHTVSPGSNLKFRWQCDEGHQWVAMVNSRTGSIATGCPSCAKSGFDPNENGYLYFLAHPDWEMLQVGITNNPDNRLNDHKRLGWEVLEIRGPMDGHLTQQWETAILRMLKAKGADLSNAAIAGRFDGYSEAWSKATFLVESIKELMKLTEEFEEK